MRAESLGCCAIRKNDGTVHSDGIPELNSKNPYIEFVYCASRDVTLNVIVYANVFAGGSNRDLFLMPQNLKRLQA